MKIMKLPTAVNMCIMKKGKVLKETSYDGEGNILEQTEYAYNIYGYVSWCKDVTGEKRYEYTYRYQ